MKAYKLLLILLITSLALSSKSEALSFKYDAPDSFSSLNIVYYAGYSLDQRTYSRMRLYNPPDAYGWPGSLITDSAVYESTTHQLLLGFTLYSHAAFYNFWMGLDMNMSFAVGYLQQQLNGSAMEGNKLSFAYGIRFAQLLGYRLGPFRIFGTLGAGFEIPGTASSYTGTGNPVTINGKAYAIDGLPGTNFFLYTGGGLAVKIWRIILRADVEYNLWNSSGQVNKQLVYCFSTGYSL